MNQPPQAQLYDFWQQPQSQCHQKQHIIPWKKYKPFTHENWLHCKTTANYQIVQDHWKTYAKKYKWVRRTLEKWNL